jgi:hypothetical protein
MMHLANPRIGTPIRLKAGEPTATVIFGCSGARVVRTLPTVAGGSGMADKQTTQAKLYAAIEQQLEAPSSSTDVLRLAEAWAWLIQPQQSHGGAPAGH